MEMCMISVSLLFMIAIWNSEEKAKVIAYLNPLPAGLRKTIGGALWAPLKGPPCGFSQIAPEVLEFRFETCHTSPGNNSTPCVKKLGPRS